MQVRVATLPDEVSPLPEVGPRVSVIIPTRNEENSIGAVIEQLRDSGVCEVIVVDGGSRDQTCRRARASGATVIESAPGRGSQQNRGAAEAQGDVLLFFTPIHFSRWIFSSTSTSCFPVKASAPAPFDWASTGPDACCAGSKTWRLAIALLPTALWRPGDLREG